MSEPSVEQLRARLDLWRRLAVLHPVMRPGSRQRVRAVVMARAVRRERELAEARRG